MKILERKELSVIGICPELAESEDERIRKMLIEQMKRWNECAIENNVVQDIKDSADAIALLEKQGKNNMGISEATKQKLEDNLNNALEKETPESWNKFLDEQGEHKPQRMVSAEAKEAMYDKPAWSQEDEEMLENIICDINTARQYVYVKSKCDEETDWLKSLKDRVQPQPQQEWSEEDEDILNTIINHFKVDVECTDEDDMVRWLKFLKDRVQPKQEWGEEDKKMLESCCGAIAAADYYTYDDKQEMESWLKSLRPQSTWKPSDNELEVLRLAAEKDGACLMGLYEQLKKLREE